jgi:OOP family OmpA-OmpF porin
VVFETGSDKLKPESSAALMYVKAYLDEKTYITLLRIESHTDANGAPDANQALTLRRSVAVARWLVGQGIDCKRLIAVGFGGTKPLADNATAEGRERNRRTVFVNAALRERPIGGMPVDGGGQVAAANLCGK